MIDSLDAVLRVVVSCGRQAGTTVSASEWELLASPRPEWRAVRRGLVFRSRETRDPVGFALGHAIEEIHPNWRRLDEALGRRARSAGLALRAYTVNGGEALESALRHDVDSVFTDDPGALRRVLEDRAGR